MGRHLITFNFLTLASSLIFQGCASTGWIKRTPKPDSQYQYYVGRSFNAKTKMEGLESAKSDAKARAVEESFGAKYKFQKDVHEQINTAQVIERSRAISRTIHLEGFEEVEIHQEEVDDNDFNTSVLYRYAKKSIETEKARLASSPDKDPEIAFNPIDTTPKEPPQLGYHKVVQTTFLLGGSLIGSTASMNEFDNSTLNYGILAEFRLARYFGLSSTIAWGGKTITYTNGSLGIRKNILGIGFPIYFASADRVSWVPFIEPGIQAGRSGFSFQNSSGDTTSDASKWQLGVTGNVGVQFRLSAEDRSAFSLRTVLGVFRPLSKTSGVTSKNSIQGGLLIIWEFFQK